LGSGVNRFREGSNPKYIVRRKLGKKRKKKEGTNRGKGKKRGRKGVSRKKGKKGAIKNFGKEIRKFGLTDQSFPGGRGCPRRGGKKDKRTKLDMKKATPLASQRLQWEKDPEKEWSLRSKGKKNIRG